MNCKYVEFANLEIVDIFSVNSWLALHTVSSPSYHICGNECFKFWIHS